MSAPATPIVLDGSHGEGGSALLRTALAMSAITQQPLRIDNVRGGTKFPGLTSEDLAIMKALAHVCEAEMIGGTVGANTISFLPTRRPRNWRAEDGGIGTDEDGFCNANVTLNTLAPVLTQSGAYSVLVAQGETYGLGALSFDAFSNVTLRALRFFGIHAFAELRTAGYGRHGQGEVELNIEPSVLQGFNGEDRGPIKSVRGIVTISELQDNVGQRGVSHLERLGHNAGLPIKAEYVRVPSKEIGAYVTIWAEHERGIGCGTAMGQRGLRIEAVVQQAYQGVFDYIRSGCTFDPYVADQVVLAAAMANGETHFNVPRLTPRFLTVVWTIKQFLPIPITIKGSEEGPGTVRIRRS